MARRILILVLGVLSLYSCISSQVRLPSSVSQVYKNEQVKQLLLLVAQNNVLFNIPEATTREVEKTEVDQKCRRIEDPLWSEKLTAYLNEFKKRPEFLNRIHIIEMKRGDVSQVQIQKDLDGAVTLSIQFVKLESRGKVGMQTELPCSSSIAEYLNREIIKTDYDFPTAKAFTDVLASLPERPTVSRFQFSNLFLTYLAERGVIFKFNHELSFEKTIKGEYIMAEILNRLGQDVKNTFHQHVNYWFKQITEQSVQAQLIQMFGVYQDKDYTSGVKVESEGDHARRVLGESDLTFVYTSYLVENENIQVVGLNELDKCLQKLTEEMSPIRLRKPASVDKESYLRPGFTCSLKSKAD